MAAPTFIQEAETSFNTSTTPKTTASFSVQAGDVLVAYAVTEGSSSDTLSTLPVGGSLTWTLRQSIIIDQYTKVAVWTAPVDSNKSMTVQFAKGGGAGSWWGANVLTFRGSDGIGASSKTNVNGAAPSLGLTTTGANSAIVAASGDWNAADGTTRTWRTVNSITPTAGNGGERHYFRDAARYTTYGAYWSDAGAAGAKTVGLSAPGSQKYSIVAVEVLAGAGGATEHERSAALSATTSIAAAGEFFSVLERSTALSAATAIAAAPQRDLLRNASLAASTSVQATGESFGVIERSASLTAATGITAAGEALTLHERSATLTASTGISATGQRDLLRSAALTASTGIGATGEAFTIVERSASLTAATVISTVPQRELLRSASITASTSITSNGELDGVIERSATLTAATGIGATGQTVHVRSASLTASTQIQASGGVSAVLERSVSITATSSITAAGAIQTTVERSASITAATLIAAVGQIGQPDTHPVFVAYAETATVTHTETAYHLTHREAAAPSFTEQHTIAHQA